MNNIIRKLSRNLTNLFSRRNVSYTTMLNSPGAYEGEGKTTLSILNTESELGLMIDGYSEVGFRLNNDITILGPMVLFRRSVLAWNIQGIEDVNEESLSIFTVLDPKLDIVVMGVGDKHDNFNAYQKIIAFSRKYRIPFEILPTDRACTTFNFLNSEGRNVAGAMIPPKYIVPTDDELMQSKLRYQNLYVVDD